MVGHCGKRVKIGKNRPSLSVLDLCSQWRGLWNGLYLVEPRLPAYVGGVSPPPTSSRFTLVGVVCTRGPYKCGFPKAALKAIPTVTTSSTVRVDHFIQSLHPISSLRMGEGWMRRKRAGVPLAQGMMAAEQVKGNGFSCFTFVQAVPTVLVCNNILNYKCPNFTFSYGMTTTYRHSRGKVPGESAWVLVQRKD
ncbi:hypothetical protein J6590_007410 [Homalodisca vitripennis]|nr:hypothetical protein J6590_007410 [Homalodisca vitripennis]